MIRRVLAACALALVASFPLSDAGAQTLAENNAALIRDMAAKLRLSPSQVAAVQKIFSRSSVIGQGNPAVTRHPISEAECRASGVVASNSRNASICGAPYMAPLYDPSKEGPGDAKACIDQFEFPGTPCTYPVVWVKASEAADLCEAVGKRLCDAHEWEGACQGALVEPDYAFSGSVAAMRASHNAKWQGSARWSYGAAYRAGVCGSNSEKSPGCNGGDFRRCGSNTYPTGSFKGCKSPLGVYDLNGNAAEHMNLPMAPDQMASEGSRKLGVTEMKGSWFIFDKFRAHPDWCRWRAPFWHGTSVRSSGSHSNYHLGFRCCKTVK